MGRPNFEQAIAPFCEDIFFNTQTCQLCWRGGESEFFWDLKGPGSAPRPMYAQSGYPSRGSIPAETLWIPVSLLAVCSAPLNTSRGVYPQQLKCLSRESRTTWYQGGASPPAGDPWGPGPLDPNEGSHCVLKSEPPSCTRGGPWDQHPPDPPEKFPPPFFTEGIHIFRVKFRLNGSSQWGLGPPGPAPGPAPGAQSDNP